MALLQEMMALGLIQLVAAPAVFAHSTSFVVLRLFHFVLGLLSPLLPSTILCSCSSPPNIAPARAPDLAVATLMF